MDVPPAEPAAVRGPFSRLSVALRTLPAARHWLETALIAAVLVAIAAPLAFATELVSTRWSLAPGATVLLALRALLLPALLEESLFRVLPNPHPLERAASARVRSRALLSLGAYVAAHPLVGLAVPAVWPVFSSWPFLAITTLLGALCLFLYRRSGSIWPGLALHWFVVFTWLGLGGHGPLPLPGE